MAAACASTISSGVDAGATEAAGPAAQSVTDVEPARCDIGMVMVLHPATGARAMNATCRPAWTPARPSVTPAVPRFRPVSRTDPAATPAARNVSTTGRGVGPPDTVCASRARANATVPNAAARARRNAPTAGELMASTLATLPERGRVT